MTAILFCSIIGFLAIWYVVGRFVLLAWTVLKNLHAALLDGIAVLKSLQPTFLALKELSTEPSPNFGAQSMGAGPAGAVAPAASVLPPFPPPLFDRFPVKPPEKDAAAEEVDATGTDTEMRESEVLEEIRAAGYEPEVDPAMPGRTVNAP